VIKFKDVDMNVHNIPSELTKLKQWVLWRLELNEKGEYTKIPYQVSGVKAKTTDPSNWATFDMVSKKSKNYSGYGFVFTDSDPYIGIDLDKCITEGKAESWAQEIIKRLDSYNEVSQSGNGVHIIIKGKLPLGCGNRKGQIEVYEKERYFCMTGIVYQDIKNINERQDVLVSILKENGLMKETSKPQQTQNAISLTDEQVIEKASNAINGSKFIKLFSGDISSFGSESEADMSLINHIAFYTQDVSQIINIVKKSPLWDQKWEREDYQKRTIEKVLSTMTEFYKPGTRGNGKDKSQTTTNQETNVGNESDKKLIKPFYLTDYGNAERLVYYHGDNIRYCEPMKSWFIWDGQRWKRDSTIEIERLAKDTVRRIYTEAGHSDNETQRKMISDHAKRSESHGRINGMVEMAKSEIEVVVDPDDLDKDGILLNCQNGTIDLKTGELLPHRKEDNITKIANVTYDRDAECPRWLQFMDEIFLGDKELIRFIKYALGYSLTTSVDEQCFFLCYGDGQNGKSKMLDTIRHIMGDYAQGVESSTFEDMKSTGQAREDIAGLKQLRFISSIETGQGHRLAENLIKQMTGDTTIRARFLYQNSFEFKQTYKIWLGTNHKPVIQGTDDGIWRRVRLIPFEFKVTPQTKDGKLFEKLIAESSGILNWMLDGCILWHTCGLDMVTPARVINATDTYRQDMDTLGTFIEECCVVGEMNRANISELHEAYMNWSNNKITRRILGFKMEEHGYRKKQFMNGWFWVGIGLNA
jgi:putative DNA primase/helicase